VTEESGQVVRIERTFAASAEDVFDAWTSPEVMRRWFQCAPDWDTPEAEVDLQVGGKVRVVMQAAALEEQWRERLGRVRANSGTDLLLHRLPGAPVLTAESAATLIGRTYKPADTAIQRLVEAGILQQITIGRRNRAYEAPEIIEAFTDLERRLASPGGEARTSPPSRNVPHARRLPR
jgi:Activator of Hsp90 ATPase homolog 1-like protein